MNLGIERFLLLGCIAILILELPEILSDLRLGDGFPGAGVAVVVEVQAAPELAFTDDVLAKLVAHEPLVQEPVRLPATPGL